LSNRWYFYISVKMIVAIIPWGIHNTAQCLVLEYLYFVYVACGCTPSELDAISPEGF
jgi:hypothetical protein